MNDKMPYLKEDEISINAKTATNASDVDDAEEPLFENKVRYMNTKSGSASCECRNNEVIQK